MKKVLVAILSLSLVGTFAWAQDEEEDAVVSSKPALKLSGSVKTGVQINTNKDRKEVKDDGTVEKVYGTGIKVESDAVGDDQGNNDGRAWRIDLNGLYDADTWGLKFGLRAQKENSDADITEGVKPSLREAFGWVGLFNKNVTLKAGIIDTAAWSTKGNRDRELSNGTGLRIEVTPTPVAGLNLGVAFMGHEGINKSDMYYSDPEEKLNKFLLSTTFGASYENDLFYAVAAYRPEGRTKSQARWQQKKQFATNQFIAGAGLKAVENLTLKVEVIYVDGFERTDKVDEHNRKTYTHYRPEYNLFTAYQISPAIDVSLEAYLWPDVDTGKVSLTDGSRDTSVDMHLYLSGGYKLNDAMTVRFKITTEDMLTKNAEDEANFYLALTPMFIYEFGTGSSLLIFDKISVVKTDKSIGNLFGIDFVWSF